MATAKKLPSGSWRALAYVGVGEDGKRRYKSFTAPTKKEAELLAAQYVAQEARAQETGMRVGEAIDRYIEIKAGILSPSTVLGYKRQRRNCYDQVSGLYIDGLTSSQLQKWISDFSRGHSPKYVRNAWGLLISAVCMFRQGFSPNVTLPQKVKGKIDIPQEDEITAFYRAIKGTKLEVPFLLATQCGLRASEIAGLRKADVDPVQERITICQARVTGERGATVKAPKSYAGYRDLPCARRICAMAVASSDAEFVTEMDANAISGAWAKFVRRGNDLPVYGFHALRHYFASKAALTGVPKDSPAPLVYWYRDSSSL